MCFSHRGPAGLLSALIVAVAAMGENKPAQTLAPAAPAFRAALAHKYAALPLYFEPNVGQTDSRVKYLARTANGMLFLTGREAVVTIRRPLPAAAAKVNAAGVAAAELAGQRVGWEQAVLRLRLEDAAENAIVAGIDRQPGASAYFLGRDPGRWRPEVPHFARVQYQAVYPGIDLVYYGDGRRLEFDFVVAPGADPGRVQMAWDGAERLRIDKEGDLVLGTRAGEIRQRKPRVYQIVDGRRVEVEAAYRVKGPRVEFELAAYDRRSPLVIDPVLEYSTYLGGSAADEILGIAVDSAGAAYVVGDTASADFPLLNAYQEVLRSVDAFVTKLNPTSGDNAVTLVYSTFLGGSGDDYAAGIAVDGSGAAYVTGNTNSADFPALNAYQMTYAGGISDAFVTKLSAYAGSGPVTLEYSSYLGGSGQDSGASIALDQAGKVYVAGFTGSTNFPILNAFQTTYGGDMFDGFVAAFNAYSGSGNLTPAYATYLGGGGTDWAFSIAVDDTGVYVGGQTTSANFPTANAFQSILKGPSDGFATKLNPYTGAGAVTLAYSTYLGGSAVDCVSAVAVDGTGAAYVAGYTYSADFPIVHPYQGALAGGGPDAFVTKLEPFTVGNVTLGYSTYLGGTGDDRISGIAVQQTDLFYVAGPTYSTDFPTLHPFQDHLSGTRDAFVAKLKGRSGAAVGLVYSTYLGGSNDERVAGLALDGLGAAFVAGTTSSADFPVRSAFQSTLSGTSDGFVTRLSSFPSQLHFVPMTPCRVVDTRNPNGPFGGPVMAARETRTFTVPAHPTCGVPGNSQAYSLNVTVVPSGPLGYLSIWPAGSPVPLVSTLNSIDGRIKANAALVPAGALGGVNVYVTDSTQVILDIDGYFIDASEPSTLAFYPVPPCRVSDTRNPNGPLGGPYIPGNTTRTIPVQTACGIPAEATAYSLNVTAVPRQGYLFYITTWPTGSPRPLASTLNAVTGTVTANAAMVPAGTGGSIDVYAYNDTDLILDINGYFAPPAMGGLSFYTLTPCRVADTRNPDGPYGGPILTGSRDFNIVGSSCGALLASAYSLNATVVPAVRLGYLTLWPQGQTRPTVSTLNALDGMVTSNAAVVSATGGAISAYGSDTTHLIVDINGYFAP